MHRIPVGDPHRRLRRLARGIGVAWLFLLGGLVLAPAARAVEYPIEASANQRFLVDQTGAPFLLLGDSPQAMLVNVSEAEAEDFFADRAAHGFNSAWVNLLCTTYTGGRPDASTYDGILPFLALLPGASSYDLGTPNEAYFARVDRVLQTAAAYGIQVILDPIETGGFLQTMIDNGAARCRNYGRFLGARYASVDNLVWMSGNDFQDWRNESSDALVREVALGIRDLDTRHLQTIELDYLESSSLDDTRWLSLLTLNATYTYHPTYARLRRDYNRPYHLPNFMVEANYEFESLQGPITTAPILRKQEYWTMTSGAAGQLYGNGYTWPFVSGWQEHLDTPGATQVGYLKTFFDPRPWTTLVPDTTHTVITSGYGTYSDGGYVADNDFLTAARSADGSLVVAYTPILRTFTVDLSKLNAPAHTRWFDPASGLYTTIAGSPFANSGLRQFTPPGPNADGDGGWVLVLETQPPETIPPAVTLVTPVDGAIVSDTVALLATASDNVGVIGVQFQIDGANLGSERFTPPYAIDWDSRGATNGPHVVRAVARDLAGNRGEDQATVTVQNLVPPPPTDHLALAYSFDEGSGSSIADGSGNGNTGTLHGASFAAGHSGSAIAFSGVSGYVETPNSPSLDIAGAGITIAFWTRINSTTNGVDYVLVGKPWLGSSMPSPFYQYGVEYSNSGNKTVDFFFGDATGGLHGPFRLPATAGAWTHVAWSYDGTTVKGYLDGVLQLSTGVTSALTARHQTLRLGVDGAYQQFMNGRLDDLRIWSRALTAAEVQSAMQSPVGDETSGLAATPRRAPFDLAIAPNPGEGRVEISFTASDGAPLAITIFDSSGRRVRAWPGLLLPSGRQRVIWDGRDEQGRLLPAGRFFARVASGTRVSTAPIALLR
ncbi:MAG: DUF4038 domain-containing protein [Candidatus Eisenbacteria bacterium]